MVGSVEKISERYLIPILAQMLDSFLFAIIGFHANNGSEYIDRHAVALLRKLLIEFTKSRSRQTNDNALAEGKMHL
jgi:transposase InsO family protein|tara:strand:+ start:148 stop:375 length:228 start_codon:yes stop_codon:yes gene_type:complete